MKNFQKKVVALILISALGGSYLASAVNLVSARSIKKPETMRARYQKARQTYLNEVNAYRSARDNFRSAKERFRKFKNAENRAKYKKAAQNFLSKSVSVLIRYLEALKNKAENVRGISDEERQSIIADIDENINWLKEEESKLSGDLSNDQLKEEAKAIRSYWKNVKLTFKKSIAKIWIARVSFVVDKAENFANRLDSKIQELKEAGKDTSQLEEWLVDLNNSIKNAKEKVEKAREKEKNISKANMDQMMREIHQFVKDANNYIRKSYSQLVQIVKEMKKMGE